MGKSNKDKPKKYYAVKKGKKPGIYIKWDECKAQIFKYPGAIYKSFKTLSEAKQFMENKSNIEIIKSNNEKIKSIKEKNNFNDEKYKFSEEKVRHMLTLMVLLTYIKKFMAMEVLLNIKIKVI